MKNKKIALFTIFNGANYGSVLQTLATQKIFINEGYECKVINYIPKSKSFITILNKSKKKYRGIKKVLYKIAKAISLIIRNIPFRMFIKKYINLSKSKYKNIDDIYKKQIDADIYIVGSDQVWNSKYNNGIDPVFYLTFINNKKKIAFVSSFGKENLGNECNEIKKNLTSFDLISVREQNAVDELKKIDIDATLLIDPTLQLDSITWANYARKNKMKEKYVLLFIIYGEDNGATDIARKIADDKKIKLIKLSWDIRKDKRIDKLYTHKGPDYFLSLIKNAEFVITNSFHGTAFSINFNKEFLVIEREEFNSRIESLLNLLNLKNRLVKINEKENKEYLNKIDYASVNKILENERIKSKKLIEKF